MQRLGQIVSELRKDKKVLFFLAAFFFYIDGVYTIIDMATAYGTALGLDTTGLLLALLLTQIVAFPAALLFGKISRKVSVIETDSGMYFCVFSDRSVWDRTSQAVSVLDPGSLCGMFSGSSSVHVPFLLCEDHSGRKIRRILRNL